MKENKFIFDSKNLVVDYIYISFNIQGPINYSINPKSIGSKASSWLFFSNAFSTVSNGVLALTLI